MQLVLLAELADRPCVDRIEVVRRSRGQRQRPPERDRVAEGVKERKNSEHHLVWDELDELLDGVDVGVDIAVGQHDPLRFAGATRRENDREQAVWVDVGEAELSFNQGQGHDRAPEGGDRCVELGPAIAKLLSENDLGVEFDGLLLEERAAGQNMLDARVSDAEVDLVFRQGVVQVDRDALREGERGIDRGRADARREQHADGRFVG